MKAELANKDVLNPEEAIELFTLSRRKFYGLLKTETELGFLAKYKTRHLILRAEFDRYLKFHPELRRRGYDGN